MKLIDILVEELPKRGGWPDDSDGMCQSQFDCEIYTKSKIMPDFYVGERAEDCHTDNIITREQYEAALTAKNEGWIEWGGGNCPVEKGTLIDVKWRDGRIDDGIQAKVSHGHESPNKRNAISWRHFGIAHDIIAYRLHKPTKSEQVRADAWDAYAGITESDAESDLNKCIKHDAAPAWNGEGLPPIGCECEYTKESLPGNEWTQCTVDYVGASFVVYRDCYGVELTGIIGDIKFRPLRTEAERKRDEVRKAMYAAMDIVDGDIADAIYDAIAAGKIPGVKLEGL